MLGILHQRCMLRSQVCVRECCIPGTGSESFTAADTFTLSWGNATQCHYESPLTVQLFDMCILHLQLSIDYLDTGERSQKHHPREL